MATVANLEIIISAITDQADHALDKTGKKLSHDIPFAGAAAHAAMLGVGAGAVALGFGLVKSVEAAGDFQTQMNVLQSVLGASAGQMKAAQREAIQLGSDIHLPNTSAKDAAEAMTELGKAGLSMSGAMAAARGTIQLSTAAQISNADAATIQGQALNAFGLKASAAGHVADLLANAANKSTGEITDMAEALQYAGSAAHGAGQPIDMVVASIAEMSNKGLSGSVAGSSLAQVMKTLEAPTEKAQGALDKLGVSIYDSSGKMRPLTVLTDEFSKKLGGMTQEQKNQTLATIFGSRALQAARIVLDGGVGSLQKYTKAMDEQGGAQRLAEARTKGFQGAVQGLQSGLETLAINVGLKVLPPLTSVVELMEKIVSAPSVKVAVEVAWKGLKSGASSIIDDLKGDLFDKPVTVPLQFGRFGHGGDDTVKKGLISQVTDALKGVDWSGVGKQIGSGIGKTITFSSAAIDKMFGSFVEAVDAHKNQVADTFADLIFTTLSSLLDPNTWARNWKAILSVAILAIGLATGGVGDAIAEALPWTRFFIVPLIKAGDALKGAIALVFKGIDAGIVRAFPELEGVFAKGVDDLVSHFDGIREIPQTAKHALELTVAEVTAILGDIVRAGGRLAGRVGDAISRPFAAIVDKVGASMTRLLGRVLGPLGDLVGEAFSVAGEIGSAIWRGITGKLGGLGEDLAGIVRGAINAMIDAINAGLGAIASHWPDAPGLPGPPGFLKSGIPRIAHGTIDWPGGPALVGEAGQELLTLGPTLVNLPKHSKVRPLHGTQPGGDANGVQVTINQHFNSDVPAATAQQEAARAVGWELRQFGLMPQMVGGV